MAALEQSYYENGISKGYLDKDDQVLFSPQAYDITVLNECLEQKDSEYTNKDVCKEYGKGAFDNTTSGGDIAWVCTSVLIRLLSSFSIFIQLSYLPDVWTQVFPKNICEYQNTTDGEFTCDGLSERTSANDNPIRFSVNNVSVAYEATTVKELLFRNKRALPMTVGVAYVEWNIPCPEGGYTGTDDINTTEYSHYCLRVADMTSHPCPSAITKVSDDDVCYLLQEKGVTLDGEMFSNVRAKSAGDHSVTVVGWNDEQMSSHIPRRDPSHAQLPGKIVSTGAYETENPQSIATAMGGFIVQNSWTGNSQSMQYWAGDVSTWDERYICPNPTFPRNWLSCSSLVSNVTRSRRLPGNVRRAIANMGSMPKPIPNDANEESPVAVCAQNTEYMDRLLDVLAQPYEFECVLHTNDDGENATRYDCDPANRYFFDSMTPDENGLLNAKFYAVPHQDNRNYSEYTLQHVTEREISNTLTPLARHLALERLQNDPDNCGYSFLFDHTLSLFVYLSQLNPLLNIKTCFFSFPLSICLL